VTTQTGFFLLDKTSEFFGTNSGKKLTFYGTTVSAVAFDFRSILRLYWEPTLCTAITSAGWVRMTIRPLALSIL